MAVAQTNKALAIWKGTAAQFADIASKDANTLYFVQQGTGDLTGTVFVGTNQHGLIFKSVAAFPTTNMQQGVVYLGPAGESRFYNGTTWVNLSYPLVTSIDSNSTDLAVPSAKAVFTYVNTFAAGLGRLLPAVQNITGLKAVTGPMDKDLILVEDTGALYRFDSGSTDAGNDDTVVAVNGITGRWIKMITATNMTEGNGIDITNNVVSIAYDSNVFAIDSNGNITLSTTYTSNLTQSITAAANAADSAAQDAAAAQADATQALADAAAAQGDATQALADAAAAQATANAAIPKIANAAGSKVAVTASNGTVTESTYTIGGNTLGTTTNDRANKLATEAAVQAALDAAVLGDIQGNIDSAVATAASGKMDKLTGANITANNLVKMDANGNAANAGVAAGGDSFAGTDAAKKATLATEYAVTQAVATAKQEAINGAKIFWSEGSDNA